MSINVATDEVIQLSCLSLSLQAAARKGGSYALLPVRLVAFVEGALQVADGCIVGQE
jgi:hypothetical protein